MAKQLNPMPPSAKAARRTIWIQVLIALLLGGALAAAQRWNKFQTWIPQLVDDRVYRVAAGLAIGAVVLLLLTFLMRYQWRWLWILLLLIELASIGGLIWSAVKGVNWFLAIALSFVSLIALLTLNARRCRRWFHH